MNSAKAMRLFSHKIAVVISVNHSAFKRSSGAWRERTVDAHMRPVEEEALQQVSRRTLINSARRQLDNKVPQKQKIFQENNGMPVHLKGGASDAVLYRATMGLSVLGAVFVLYELGKAALPQKK